MKLVAKDYDLFISYAKDAKDDYAWVNGVLLPALDRAGIRYLTEAGINPGVPELVDYGRAIEQSQFILLVLSPADRADNYNQFIDLMAQSYALEVGTWQVIPLIFKPVQLPPRLAMLKPLKATNQAEREKAIQRLCELLKRPKPTPAPLPKCPYPGMKPFSETQSDRFFGREAEKEELLQQLRLHRFMTVIGPSGSGKSSLVFAGLIPELRKSGRFGDGEWQIEDLRPGKTPLTNLKDTLGIASSNDLELALRNNLSRATQKLLLIVDQFEEVFTVAEEEAIPFQQKLLSLIEREIPSCYIVLTVRADFYSELIESPLWERIKSRRLEIAPLKEAGLRQAIVQPAEAVSVFVETALVERLVADAANEPGVLPLIQETLVLLWEKLKWRYLTLEDYEELIALSIKVYKDIGGNKPTGLQVAIDRLANAAIADLNAEQQAIARRIFLRLIQFNEGRARTRRQQSVDDLRTTSNDKQLFDRTLLHLADRRLLTLSGRESKDRTNKKVDIAHEALISGWFQLQEWIDRRQSKEQSRRRLEAKAQEWVGFGKGNSRLLDESELPEAKEWLNSVYAQELGIDADLCELVKASERAIQRELKRERRKNRILTVFSISLFGLLCLAINQTIQTNLKNLEALSASAETLSILNKQSDALAKNIEAGQTLNFFKNPFLSFWDREDINIRIAANLNQLIYGFRERNIFRGHTKEVRSIKYSPDGKQIVSTSYDGMIKIWSSDGDLVQNIKNFDRQKNPDLVFNALFSTKGNFIISVSKDKSIKVWERNSHGCFTFKKSISTQNELINIAFSPNDRIIASDTKDREVNQVKLWNLEGKLLASEDAHKGRINKLSFSLDGQTLVSVGEDRYIKLWKIKNNTLVKLSQSFKDDADLFTVSFINDRTIVSGNISGYIKIWDLKTGQSKTLGKHDDAVEGLAVSKDGIMLASSSGDRTIKIWDLQSYRLLQTLKGHVETVNDVSFNPTSSKRMLASASSDGTVRVWSIIPHKVINGWTFSFSPDSQKIITGDREGNVRLFSTQDGS